MMTLHLLSQRLITDKWQGGDSALPTPSTLPNVFYPKSNDRYYIFGTICQIVKKPHMARRRFPMCAILILSPCFPKPYGDHFRQ